MTTYLNFFSERIAFAAYEDEKEGSVVAGKPIVFPKVITNEGCGYNSNTGIFTPPKAGVYHITAHVCVQGSDNGNFFGAAIKKSDTWVASSRTVVHKDRNGCVSFGIVVRLEETDDVKVVSQDVNGKILANQFRWNTFYGFYLFK